VAEPPSRLAVTANGHGYALALAHHMTLVLPRRRIALVDIETGPRCDGGVMIIPCIDDDEIGSILAHVSVRGSSTASRQWPQRCATRDNLLQSATVQPTAPGR
jgi:hypothetical protein